MTCYDRMALRAVLLWLLFVLLLVTGACVRTVAPRPTVRTDLDERRAAVRLTVYCRDGRARTGSGVVVDWTTVLTAYHVVSCDVVAVEAELPDRSLASLRVISALVVGDVARLEGPVLAGVPPAVVGPAPSPGGLVCVSTGHPDRARRCAPVTGRRPDRAGDLEYAAWTDFGNSGSGVYDSMGRLVGITTHRTCVDHGRKCSGLATTLYGKGFP